MARNKTIMDKRAELFFSKYIERLSTLPEEQQKLASVIIATLVEYYQMLIGQMCDSFNRQEGTKPKE